MKKRMSRVLIFVFCVMTEGHAFIGDGMRKVGDKSSNVPEGVTSFEDAVEALDGGPFEIDGERPYETEPIALIGTPPEVAAQRRLGNAIARNEYMLSLGLWPESGAGGSAKQALAELKTLESQFSNYADRNQLDMKKLNETTIPQFRRTHTALSKQAGDLRFEIGVLQEKIARGELDTKCGFLQWTSCPDNNRRLASKKAQLKLYQDRLNQLTSGLGTLQTNVDRELQARQGSLVNNDEFGNKVLKVIRDNKNVVAQEVAELIGDAIKANRDAIEKNIDELVSLRTDLGNLKNQVENSMQNVGMEQFKVQLSESLASQMEAIKRQFLESACDQAPSCVNRSPLEALPIHDSPRRNPIPQGSSFDPYDDYDADLRGGGTTGQ